MTATENLQGAWDALCNSADDTGCSNGLTVIDGRWLDEVDTAIGDVRKGTTELLEACRAVVNSPGFGDATEPGRPSDVDGGPVNVTYFSQETVDALRAAIVKSRGETV